LASKHKVDGAERGGVWKGGVPQRSPLPHLEWSLGRVCGFFAKSVLTFWAETEAHLTVGH